MGTPYVSKRRILSSEGAVTDPGAIQALVCNPEKLQFRCPRTEPGAEGFWQSAVALGRTLS
jgi:hypothetical protein